MVCAHYSREYYTTPSPLLVVPVGIYFRTKKKRRIKTAVFCGGANDMCAHCTLHTTNDQTPLLTVYGLVAANWKHPRANSNKLQMDRCVSTEDFKLKARAREFSGPCGSEDWSVQLRLLQMTLANCVFKFEDICTMYYDYV